MLVSTDRPRAIAVMLAPLPRWAHHYLELGQPSAQHGVGRAGDRLEGGAVEAIAPHSVAVVVIVRQGVDVGAWRDGGVEARVEDGHLGYVGQHPQAPPGCPAEPGDCGAAPAEAHSSILCTTSGVSRAGPLKYLPPCTTRCPTASTSERSFSGPPPATTSLSRMASSARPWSGMPSSSPMRLMSPPARTGPPSESRSSYLMDELPELSTKTFILERRSLLRRTRAAAS